jgi:enoyl-CoA hydratase
MASTTATDSVLTARHGTTLVITLNRPDQRNAVDLAVAEGIAAALDRLDADDELAVGILCGTGRGFCAGMDLKGFAATGRQPWVGDRGFGGIVRRAARKPLIAAVDGFAVAGGFEIALACDLIVAGRDARFGLPEVKRSLVAAGGGLLRLPRRMPYHVAMELALTGDPMDAQRLHGFGVVNRLTEPGEALDGALELAAQISVNAPLALRASKAIVERSLDWPAQEAWDRQAEIADPVLASEDAREGALAFAQKRDPVWRGR